MLDYYRPNECWLGVDFKCDAGIGKCSLNLVPNYLIVWPMYYFGTVITFHLVHASFDLVYCVIQTFSFKITVWFILDS